MSSGRKRDQRRHHMQTIESIAALDVTDHRKSILLSALEAGATEEDFTDILACKRLELGTSVVIPQHHLEGKARGRGWARKGKGAQAVWGERTENGYRVGAGVWTVGGDDGFTRKGEDRWTVKTLTIGSLSVTLAFG
jgi:hypothetical protein